MVTVFFILRHTPDDRAGKKLAMLADRRMAGEDAMTADLTVVPERHISVENRIRANADSFAQLCFGINNSSFVNLCFVHDYSSKYETSVNANIMSASATTSPLTLASARIWAVFSRSRKTLTSKIN